VRGKKVSSLFTSSADEGSGAIKQDPSTTTTDVF